MNDDLHSTAPHDSIEEQLVAYLDDELDADAAAAVERRLADDPAYQQKLRELQKTWDLLDNLPQASVGERFAQTTVELVVQSAAADAEQKKSSLQWRLWLLRVGSVAAAVLAGFVGYLLVTAFASRSNNQLVRDLPVIENADAYRYAGSVEFLEELDREGLFADQESGNEM
ncbi:MAG: hypothetical protein RIC55_30180 [Pirellulaceae bacterium]